MSTDERRSNKTDSSHRNKSYEYSKHRGEEIGAFFIVIHWRDPAKECHQTKNLAKRHAI